MTENTMTLEETLAKFSKEPPEDLDPFPSAEPMQPAAVPVPQGISPEARTAMDNLLKSVDTTEPAALASHAFDCIFLLTLDHQWYDDITRKVNEAYVGIKGERDKAMAFLSEMEIIDKLRVNAAKKQKTIQNAVDSLQKSIDKANEAIGHLEAIESFWKE